MRFFIFILADLWVFIKIVLTAPPNSQPPLLILADEVQGLRNKGRELQAQVLKRSRADQQQLFLRLLGRGLVVGVLLCGAAWLLFSLPLQNWATRILAFLSLGFGIILIGLAALALRRLFKLGTAASEIDPKRRARQIANSLRLLDPVLADQILRAANGYTVPENSADVISHKDLIYRVRQIDPAGADELEKEWAQKTPSARLSPIGVVAGRDRAPGGSPLTRKETLVLSLARLVVALAVLFALLPIAAIIRGLVRVWASSGGPSSSPIGIPLATIALLIGAFFFIYSIKYYTASFFTLASLWSSNGENHSREGDGRSSNGSKQIVLGRQPLVSIHIATYNEKRVMARLLEACFKLTYQNYEVIVVDDSTDETLEILEQWKNQPGLKILHRPTRAGYKGGALAEALKMMNPATEYIIVLDADSLPFPDLIQRFLPHFYVYPEALASYDEKIQQDARFTNLAAVQSYQWHVLNKSETWITQAVRAEFSGSYMVERVFEETVAALRMIAGTAYMIRADVLQEFGWGNSITEDWELTLRLYEKGWKVAYTPYSEVPAECVSDFRRLKRQRMRWAEGHTHQVRRHFRKIILNKDLTWAERGEFLYFAPYYLQAVLLVVGSACWFASDIIFKAHLPEWTSLLGWSLVLTNLLSLPFMNLAGLLLEQAPVRDWRGVWWAFWTSTLLSPYQGWAALKGLLEREEGPWFRTPKSGRITDPVEHLHKWGWLRRWLKRSNSQPAPSLAPHTPMVASRPRHAPWLAIIGVFAILVFIGRYAFTPGAVFANPDTFYLHNCVSPYAMNATAPGGGAPCSWIMTTTGYSQTWVSSSSYPAGTSIPAGAYTLTFWAEGAGVDSSTTTMTFGYSTTANNCASGTVTTMVTWSPTLTTGNGQTTSPPNTSSTTVLPVYGAPNSYYLCFTITVTAFTSHGVIFRWDNNAKQTHLDTPTITVAEMLTPLLGLAIMIPIFWRYLIRPVRQRRISKS